MAVNAVLAVGLAMLIGWIAAAIATTVAGWVMVVQLSGGARRFGEVARFDAQFRRRLWRICLASGLMGAVLWGAGAVMGPLFGMGGVRWLALLALIAVGGLVYALFGQALGAFRMQEIRGRLRR
jgi:putative peptidoglycan lipid II flippase